MAKRGERRPWRVRFEWCESGIKGCETWGTQEDAQRFADSLLRTAELRDRSVKVTIEDRDEPQRITVSIAPNEAQRRSVPNDVP